MKRLHAHTPIGASASAMAFKIFLCRLFACPRMTGLAEPHPGSASVLIDELDAGGFQYLSNLRDRFRISGIPTHLYVRDCVSVQPGCVSQISHRPIKRCASHPDLCACHSSFTCAIVTCVECTCDDEKAETVMGEKGTVKQPGYIAPPFHRRLRCPDHHGARREGADPPCGRKSAASSDRRTSPATSSSSSASPPRTSTGPGTNAPPGGRSRRCRRGSSTRSSPSWRPPSTAWWRGPGRCTRPSSCCHGRSRRRRRLSYLRKRARL